MVQPLFLQNSDPPANDDLIHNGLGPPLLINNEESTLFLGHMEAFFSIQVPFFQINLVYVKLM